MRISALIAFFYLALIPSFALLYTSVSEEFHYSTSQSEPGFFDLKRRIEEEMKRELERTCNVSIQQRTVEVPNTVSSTDWRVVPPKTVTLTFERCAIHIDRISYEDRKLSVNFFLNLVTDARNFLSVHEGEYIIEMEVPQFYFDDVSRKTLHVRPPDEYQPQYRLEGRVRSYFLHPFSNWAIPAQIFEENNVMHESTKEIWFFETTTRFVSDTISFAKSYEGQPVASNDFLRMMYLSAVTITTLGYGDIVPTTDRARALIALQAVLGVVIVGLFLLSLSSDLGFRTKR